MQREGLSGLGGVADLGRARKIQREGFFCSEGKSLSSVFTQTRLFWPDGVKILFLMVNNVLIARDFLIVRTVVIIG